MTHADPVETMRRLEQWAAVHQNFRIEQYGCQDVNSDYIVHLESDSTGKEVTAYAGDLWYDHPDYLTIETPTLCDVIKWALDRWEGLVPQYGEEDGPPATTE